MVRKSTNWFAKARLSTNNAQFVFPLIVQGRILRLSIEPHVVFRKSHSA